MRAALDGYLETQVMTSSPERLHLLLVDGALRFARLGAAALEARDPSAAQIALSRSQACVAELNSGLDSRQNPELVEQFRSLLTFTYQNLALSVVDHDLEKVRDAIQVLTMHRDNWVTLIERLQREQGAQPRRAAVNVDIDGPMHSWEG